MPAGRPSEYTQDLADEILLRMMEGESVRSICRDEEMPALSTVMLWVVKDREGFSEQYAKAAEARAHYWADEILDIADNSRNDWLEREDPENPGYTLNGEAIQRAKLRVDTRKWMLSKMLPKFADKQQHELSGPNGDPIKTESKVEWTIQPVKPINETGSDEKDS